MAKLVKLCYLIVTILINISNIDCFGEDSYLELKYGEIIPTKKNSENIFLTIPCEARIGSCTFTYSQYPYDWKVSPNGSLILPLNTINAEVLFSINVRISEPTGEFIEKKLIIEVTGQKFYLMDADQFYQNLRFTSKPTKIPIEQRSSALFYEQIPYPSLSEVKITLESTNYLKIALLLADILSIQADCDIKQTYFEDLIFLVQKQRAQNSATIYFSEEESNNFNVTLQKLKTEKNAIAKQLIKQQNQINNERLQQLQQLKNKKFYQYFNTSSVSKLYLNKIRNSKPIQSQYNETDIDDIQQDQSQTLLDIIEDQEEQLNEINRQIKELINQKKKVEISIFQKKSTIEVRKIGEVVPQNLQSLEEKYLNFSSQTAKKKQEYQKYDYEISEILSESELLRNSIVSVNAQISMLEDKIKTEQKNPELKQAQSLKDINLILSSNNISYNREVSRLNC